MLKLLHYFESSSTDFIYLHCFLNSQDIFKERHLSLTQRHLSLTKSRASTGIRERRRSDNLFFFSVALYLESLHCCRYFVYSLEK